MDFIKPLKFYFFSWSNDIIPNVNIYFIVVWGILVKGFLDPISMCVCVIFPHQQTVIKHPQGVWEFNSSLALFPGDSIRFHRLKVQSHKIHTHTFRRQSQTQVVTYTSDQLGIDRRFPWPPPWHSDATHKSRMLTWTSDRLAINQRFPRIPPWVQLFC